MSSMSAWMLSRLRHIGLALFIFISLVGLWLTHTGGDWSSLPGFGGETDGYDHDHDSYWNNTDVSEIDILAHMLPKKNLSSIPFDDILAIYRAQLIEPSTPKFPIGSEMFDNGHEVIWKERMGKKICIVDIDDRGFTNENELFGPTPFDWPNFSSNNAGILTHYLYAMVHGYDYKLIHTPAFPDRDAYWTKPPAVSDTLHDYTIVVSIDADAQFNHPPIPFEWLLNRWNVTRGTTHMTMALDPPDEPNLDDHGRVVNNAGFVVAQNTPRTHEILRAWSDCPEEHGEAYANCARFKRGWPAEQGAFANYVRYAFTEPGDLNEIACDEANGSADHVVEDPPTSRWVHSCQGRFIEHHTLTKALVKRNIERVHAAMLVPKVFDPLVSTRATDERVYHAVGKVLMKRVYEQFIAEKDLRVVQRETNEFMVLDE